MAEGVEWKRGKKVLFEPIWRGKRFSVIDKKNRERNRVEKTKICFSKEDMAELFLNGKRRIADKVEREQNRIVEGNEFFLHLGKRRK